MDFRSDCWNDVDETEFACSEKKRILLKLKPPGWYARRKILLAIISTLFLNLKLQLVTLIYFHFLFQGSENLVNVERAHLIPKNRQGDYKVKRLDPETGDGRPARFLDAEESLEKDLLEEAKKQEKNRRNRKPKHDF